LSAVQEKPLGIKAYGHIGHLPNSRMGPGDHHCHQGQARIATEKARDRHDQIIVTEKVDGSCVAVARKDGVLIPLIRAGWPAAQSRHEMHHLFHHWVMANQQRFLDRLQDGERLVGEWLALAHGTRYQMAHEPLVIFDLMTGARRLPFRVLHERLGGQDGFTSPKLLHAGGPIAVPAALELLGPMGHHGAIEPTEGVVYRVERRGEFDFMAKWVRPDKVDGCYLPEVSGQPPVWNWRPGRSG